MRQSRHQNHGRVDRARRVGGTTGEWAGALRSVSANTAPRPSAAATGDPAGIGSVATSKLMTGGPPRLLVAKPGLDGIRTAPSRSRLQLVTRYGGSVLEFDSAAKIVGRARRGPDVTTVDHPWIHLGSFLPS